MSDRQWTVEPTRPPFGMFSENCFFVQKIKKTIQTALTERCKSHMWGYISAHSMCDLHLLYYKYKCTIHADAYTGRSERHLLWIRPSLFPGSQRISQRNDARPNSAVQHRGFADTECMCLTGLSAVQICILLIMYGASWRKKNPTRASNRQQQQQQQHGCCQQLKSFI